MKLTFILSLLLLLGIISLGVKADYTLQYLNREKDQVIEFYGGFGKTSFDQAKSFLTQLEKNKNVLLKIQRGYGGDVKEHKKFIKLIRKSCPKNKCILTTHLLGQCSSMCSTLFLSGDVRIAEKDPFANLGLHRTLISIAGRRVPIQGPRSMAKYFQEFEGVNKEYIWKNRNKFFKQPGNGLYHVWGEELLKAGFAHFIIN